MISYSWYTLRILGKDYADMQYYYDNAKNSLKISKTVNLRAFTIMLHSSSSIFVPRNLGFCTISRLCRTFSESGNCMPISRLCSTGAQFQDRTIPVACTTEPRWLFELPWCIKVRNVCKELLQLRHHHQRQACTQASHASDFWEVCQLRETPIPSVLVPTQKDPRPVECPHSRLHQLGELSPLFD